MTGRIIIADTSSLIALNNINHLLLLKELFEKTLITPQVQKEYGPNLPDWIDIVNPVNESLFHKLCSQIDTGEASAITLAIQYQDSTLLIDEKDGRNIARLNGVHCIGVLGLLLKAKRQNKIIALKPLIQQLLDTKFRIATPLIQYILQEAGEN